MMIHEASQGVRGNSDELRKAADLLDGISSDIAQIYANRTGKDIEEVRKMMKAETWIYAAEALEMGFVGTVINDKVSARKLGTIKAQLNINTMNKEFTAEQKSWFEKKFDSLSKLLKGNIKNMVVKLEDGAEVFVETEDGDLMGKKVFTVVDGNPTADAAPNGEHATADGRIIVVADGIITEVKESADTEASKELETVKAELENLKAELTAKENVIAEKEIEIQARAKDITTFKAEFEAFKNKIVTGDIVNEQDFPKGGEQKKDIVTATLEYRKNKK
jgi:hypothetical protein